VVNIDNGFGGGYMATIINRLGPGTHTLGKPDGGQRLMECV